MAFHKCQSEEVRNEGSNCMKSTFSLLVSHTAMLAICVFYALKPELGFDDDFARQI